GVERRRAALVCGHPERRVSLEMLDRPEAFARGESDVFVSHVVLKIDESLASGLADEPEGSHLAGFLIGAPLLLGRAGETQLLRGSRSRLGTFAQRLAQSESAA